MSNVVKRISKDGEISYYIRASNGYDSNGNQIKKNFTWKPDPKMTPKQIEKELKKQVILFEEKVKNGFIIDENIKFNEYAQRWLDVNKANFAPITYTRYETLLIRINKAIGHLRIGKIQSMHLQEFYKNLREIKSERTGNPLSDQTIKHYHRCISAILTQATRERIIQRNVASHDFMNAPKIIKKEMSHLNEEQAREFVMLLNDEHDIRVKTALTLLIFSGCRIGELCGFEWKDCDFDKHTINVKRSSQFCKGHGMFTKEPKNETSKRTIHLSDSVFSLLSEYRRWYLEQQLANGDRWINSDRLFIQSDGKPLTPTTVNKWLNKFLSKHSLPHITPHGLRHTNITLMIMNGIDVRTVASKAGHSRTSTTLDIYSHALQYADEMATAVLDNVLTSEL